MKLKDSMQEFPLKKTIAFFILLISLLVLVYSNHFKNAFHFDDSHTIKNNVYI